MKKINNVCLVDDDEVYRFIIKKEIELTQMVNTVLSFDNGQRMLDYCLANISNPDMVPDIILLDINMPIMNGWEFLDKIKGIRDQLAKELYILIISSSIDKRDISRANQHELIKDYLIKPVDRNQLSEHFKKILAN